MAYKSSICTVSLGRAFAGHGLEHKLDMAQKYGFQGIELFYEDLEHATKSLLGDCSEPNLLTAARHTRHWCAARHLEIICLQPFMHYGGLVDRERQRKQLVEINFWIELAHALGTDLILFPSSFLPADHLTKELSCLVRDFQDAADAGMRSAPTVRFAFEALCWGTQVHTWEDSWRVVAAVNRPNFGLCLDTFNIAGRTFADPAARSGRTWNSNATLERSMKRLMEQVDVGKLFLVQVADAERLEQPLDKRHHFYNAEQPARMSWSRNCRLFYGEAGLRGYLPVKAVLQTVLHGLGYKGWMSFEVFHRKLADRDAATPEYLAARASQSWTRLARDLALEVNDSPSVVRAVL